jgi:hypothetical protein
MVWCLGSGRLATATADRAVESLWGGLVQSTVAEQSTRSIIWCFVAMLG